MSSFQTRTYPRADSIVFLKTNEVFGGLSNMASGFPVVVNGFRIRTCEALYQACRFPHRPDVQRLIFAWKSPMTAKMKSKPFRRDSRADWEGVRVDIMRWCLRVKLAQNWCAFSELLLKTADRPIVEQSRKDDFWGAKPTDECTLVGMNVLGRLLMELREAVKAEGRDSLLLVQPLAIPDFMLGGRPIGIVTAKDDKLDVSMVQTAAKPPDFHGDRLAVQQPSLFDVPVVNETILLAQPVVSKRGVGIANLKPYPTMKDPGEEWLREVPEHWRSAPVRRYCRVFAGATPSRSIAQYWESGSIPWLSSGEVNLRRIRTARQFITEAGLKSSSTNWIRPGSLVLALAGQGRTKGMVATVEFFTTCNQSLAAIEPAKCESRYEYLAYYLESRYRNIRALVGDGLRDGLNLEHVRSIPTPLPPLSEQTAIVRFLDHTDRHIRRYIRAKQKLIALLEEQKQVIIHQAVTGQIDVRTGQPYPDYKPSGVEWLGEVPVQWETRRLKTLCSMKSGESITAISIEPIGEYPVYGGNGIRGYTSNYTHDGKFALIGRQGALCGNIHVASGQFWASEHAVVVTLNSCFVLEWFSAILGVMNLNQYSIAAAQPGLSVERVLNLWVPVPPSQEQAAIARYLDKAAAQIDDGIAPAQTEINLLREYRNRLIADVVTGKLDVREAAAALPEVDPLAAEETLDDTLNADVELDIDELEAIPEEVEA